MKELIELDTTDRKLVRILQEDASQSIQQLSEQVGLTVNPCWRRIKRLEEKGVIGKRVAVVNPERLGLGTVAIVLIKTDQHTNDWLTTFKQAVQDIPEIVECHRMTGAVDYLIKMQLRDLGHYDKVYQRLIRLVPSLTDVSSTFSMENLKPNAVLEVPPQ